MLDSIFCVLKSGSIAVLLRYFRIMDRPGLLEPNGMSVMFENINESICEHWATCICYTWICNVIAFGLAGSSDSFYLLCNNDCVLCRFDEARVNMKSRCNNNNTIIISVIMDGKLPIAWLSAFRFLISVLCAFFTFHSWIQGAGFVMFVFIFFSNESLIHNS